MVVNLCTCELRLKTNAHLCNSQEQRTSTKRMRRDATRGAVKSDTGMSLDAAGGGDEVHSEPPCYVIDADQNHDFSGGGLLFPCLVTHGLIIDIVNNYKIASPKELHLLQGENVLLPKGACGKWQCCIGDVMNTLENPRRAGWRWSNLLAIHKLSTSCYRGSLTMCP